MGAKSLLLIRDFLLPPRSNWKLRSSRL